MLVFLPLLIFNCHCNKPLGVMALSLSPCELNHQIIHPPIISQTLQQSHIAATPRQYNTVTQKSHEHQILSMRPSQLNSDFGANKNLHNQLLSSQKVTELPSGTPLTILGDERDKGSEPEVEKLSIRNAADHSTAGWIQQLSSGFTSSKKKNAQFDGVLITTKPPRYKKQKLQNQPGPAHISKTREFSLVDALARTFHANRYTENPSRISSYRHDSNASVTSKTDAEITEVESEYEQHQLSKRLVQTSLKRGFAQAAASANASESNSESTGYLLQGIPQPNDRQVKRLKPIPYDTNAALIDAALGTVEAPIAWDTGSELDYITRDSDAESDPSAGIQDLAKNAHVTSSPSGAQMVVEESHPVPDPSRGNYMLSSSSTLALGDKHNKGLSKGGTLSPYLSRGAQFKQKLEAIFGENVTVRRDKAARPRPPDHDFFAPYEEYDREPSPDTSESAASISPASNGEEVASAISSTHVTSQSPDIHPAGVDVDQPSKNQVKEADSFTGPAFGAREEEEQRDGWVVALQRLIKGKVRIREENLEALSIVLAEIESLKDTLNESVLMAPELLTSLKQVSELHDIPFGDRNKIRQRAQNIVQTWPYTGEQGTS